MPKIGSQPDVSGEYVFEDTNLDMFVLYDFQLTTLYHGENMPIKTYYDVRKLLLL